MRCCWSIPCLGLVALLAGLAPSIAMSQIQYDASLAIKGELAQGGGFEIRYADATVQAGELFRLDVAIRAPQHAKEILEFNANSPGSPDRLNIHCVPFASFATIEEIEFLAIENLPSGIIATTNAKDLKALGGEVVALQFAGRSTAAGSYALIFKLKARASAMGIVGPTAHCDVTGATITIE